MRNVYIIHFIIKDNIMNKLILIDGSSILSSGFFATLPHSYYKVKTQEEKKEILKNIMRTKDGTPTNGVYPMIKTIEKLINKVKPSHLAVAWDISRDTFRRDMYTEYKGNRDETLEELKIQYGIAQKVLDEIGIKQYKIPKFEADDIIGTLAKKFSENLPVFILTKDQDQLQLIDENIRVWLITSTADKKFEELNINAKDFLIPDGVFEFSLGNFEYFYGVSPEQLIDRKGMEGDKSDNIPGIPGIGEKSAIPLIKEFGSIENIYEYVEGTPEEEMKEMFKILGIRSPLKKLKNADGNLTAKEYGLLSKKLATICCCVPGMEKIIIDDLKLAINIKQREDIYKKLEFKSLIK